MKRILVLTAVGIISSPAASAAVSEDDFEELRRQLAAISQRLEDLAAENAALKRAQGQTATAIADVQTSVAVAAAAQSPAGNEAWSDRIRLDGDFRYRYETIDPEGSPRRERNRIRGRANIRAELADDVEVGFGLATGGDDPVSTNQTLGGGGSSKSVALNLAYVDWKAADGLRVLGGKFKNPLVKVGKQALMWDGDWTPEGIALSYKRDWFFANALGTYLESDTRRGNDNFSWGAQFGATGEIGGAKIKGGIGYYSIQTKGESTTFGDAADSGDYFGNTAVEGSGLDCGATADTICAYLYDYLLTEIFAEAAFDIGDRPAVVFFDYVNNSDPSDNDTGWTAGTRIGEAKDRGQMQFSYYYADKEADSVLGLLTDSDFGGGGTDNKGHFLQLNYGVNQSWSIGAQYFINETDVSTGSKSDYDRLMIDTQWKWK
ncbi:MAG: putative porin [Woeseiaceae bacterium]